MKEALEANGERVVVMHYADLLKYLCKSYFNWDGLKDDGGRRLLQRVGTDVVRSRSPDFWVDFLVSLLKLFGDEWDWVLIPDTRFPNEVNRMKEEFGAKHIRVVRPDFASPLSKEGQSHLSETALDDATPDWLVLNRGTLDDLKKAVIHLLEEITYADKA